MRCTQKTVISFLHTRMNLSNYIFNHIISIFFSKIYRLGLFFSNMFIPIPYHVKTNSQNYESAFKSESIPDQSVPAISSEIMPQIQECKELDVSVNTQNYEPLDISMCKIFKNNRHFTDSRCIRYNRRRRAGIILVTPDNEIVVVKNKSYGIWGLPKGKIKRQDRCFTDAAARELLEETGIVLLPTKENSFVKNIDQTTYYVMCVSFLSRDKFCPQDEFEIGKVQLIPISNIMSLRNINKGLLILYRQVTGHRVPDIKRTKHHIMISN